MAGIKIDPEMLDIYMELLNKLMAGSETDGGNARLEVSGAGKTEDGLVQYNDCLLYTSPSPRDQRGSRMPSSA